jgi:hypothetical protein
MIDLGFDTFPGLVETFLSAMEMNDEYVGIMMF